MKTPTNDGSRRARALFEAQVDALDGATATALRARRREALASMPARRRSAWWWPASGIATAALAVALWLPRGDAPTPADGNAATVVATGTASSRTPARHPASVDGARASAAANGGQDAAAARFADTALVELDNDADFYAWLATVPEDAGASTDQAALPSDTTQEGWTL